MFLEFFCYFLKMSCFAICDIVNFEHKQCEKFTKKNKRCKNSYQVLSVDGNHRLCTFHSRKYKINYYLSMYEKANALPFNKDIKEYIHKILLQYAKKDEMISDALNERCIIIPQIAFHLKNCLHNYSLDSHFESKLEVQSNIIANQIFYLEMNTSINDIFEHITNYHKNKCGWCDGIISNIRNNIMHL